MKALLILLLALGTAYAGYQYAYQPLVVDTLGITPPVDKPVELPAPKEAPPPPPKPVEHIAPKHVAVAPQPIERKPTVVVSHDLGMQAKDPSGFEPPVFASIEEITKNWTAIPKNLFMRRPPIMVKLGKNVAYKMTVGAIDVKAGATAAAVGQENGMLVVAPDLDSPGRAQIPVEDTDIKPIIIAIYEKYKSDQIAMAKRQFEAAKLAASRPDTFGQRKNISGPAKNDKPTRNADGSYPVLVESMRLGQVREITPQNIKKWGDLQQDEIDGKRYWTVVVSYTTKTMFGDFNVDAQARIFGGKVEKWVYTGSGEVVP